MTPARRSFLPLWVVVALAVTTAVLVVAVVALGWRVSPDEEKRSNGPLYLGFMDGQYTTYPPDGIDDWWGSYASAFLCLNEKAADVRITGVELITREGPRPIDSEVMVRTVTSSDLGGDTVLTDLVSSAYGRANEPALPYAPEPVYESGQFSGPEGIEVTRTCEEIDNPDGGMKVPAQEMVISLLSADGGAVVDSVEVEYEVGDEKYQLVRDFRMLQCGPTVAAEVRSRFDDTEAVCSR